MKTRSCVLSLAAAVVCVFPIAAQELPEADDLIEGYVEAIGGRDAYLSITSVRQVGSVMAAAMGIEGTFEILASAENRFRMSIELPGLGTVESGYDGETGWTANPLIGPAIMQGAELAQARDNAQWRGELRDPDLVPVRETVEAAEFGGESCWKVRLEWASGRESFDCYSQETGLLVATEETQASAMGEVPVSTLLGDYREIGGVMFPGRVTQTSVGQTLEISVSEVELNSVEASAFEPPRAVSALIGAGGGG